jgi:hypothetical protein
MLESANLRTYKSMIPKLERSFSEDHTHIKTLTATPRKSRKSCNNSLTTQKPRPSSNSAQTGQSNSQRINYSSEINLDRINTFIEIVLVELTSVYMITPPRVSCFQTDVYVDQKSASLLSTRQRPRNALANLAKQHMRSRLALDHILNNSCGA